MGATFDKNEGLLKGYLDWCNTEPEEWEGNHVGQLIDDNVVLVDEERNERSEGRAAVLEHLARLKAATTVDPLSVRVGTTHDGTQSFGCDWEVMGDRPERQGWHTCFDRFEWTGDRISAIYVCPADDHSLHSAAHH